MFNTFIYNNINTMTPEEVKDILRKKIALQEASKNTMDNPNSDEIPVEVVEETPDADIAMEVTEAPLKPEEIQAQIQIHQDAIAQLEALLEEKAS